MCIFGKMDAPQLKPLPTTPTVNDEEVRRREAEERARLAAAGGTAGTVKTDLAPGSLVGQKRVLLGV